MSDGARVIDLAAFRQRRAMMAAAKGPATFAEDYALREMQLMYDGASWIRVHDEPTPEQRAVMARADGRIVLGGKSWPVVDLGPTVLRSAEGRGFELTIPGGTQGDDGTEDDDRTDTDAE